MWQQLESKKAIGESRHVAKLLAKEYGNKVETIHSYKTYNAYKQASKTFCKWVKSEFPEIKYINQIDKDIAAMYIRYREKIGCSPYTYSQDIAMINKILDLGITKSYCGVANRSIKAIKNSRIDNGYRTKSGKIETIIKGTGLRRNELKHLRVKDMIISNKLVTGIMVTKGSKGGKSRIIQVRKEFQAKIYNLIYELNEDENVIKGNIPKNLQTHRLRAEYAQNMIEELKVLGRKDPYKDLTEYMGHNRITVLAHYGVKK